MNSFWLILLVFSLSTITTISCQVPTEPKQNLEEPQKSPKTLSVLAKAGTIELGERDFYLSLLRAKIAGEAISEQALKNPDFLRQRWMQILRRAWIKTHAKEAGINPSHKELVAFVQKNLPAWAQKSPEALAQTLNAWHATPEDFWTLIESDVLIEQWTEKLLREINAQALWERYRAEYTYWDLWLIRVLNLPTPRELDVFIPEHLSEIQNYYEVHKEDFQRTRTRVLMTAKGTVVHHGKHIARPLDPNTMREIASTLMQEQGPLPHALHKARKLLEMLKNGQAPNSDKPLITWASSQGATVKHIRHLKKSDYPQIKGFGALPSVFDAIQHLKQGTWPEDVILEGHYFYIPVIEVRVDANVQKFFKEAKAYRERVVQRERPRILWNYVIQHMNDKIWLDLNYDYVKGARERGLFP